MLSKIGNTARTIKQEAVNSLRDLKRGHLPSVEVSDEKVLAALADTGIYIVNDFWSANQCATAIATIDSLLDTYADHIWKDAAGADYRIFGADRVSPVIQPFYRDPFITRIVQAYERSETIRGFTLAAKIAYKVNNLGSGGGWHRDRADARQIKALVYLSDVDAQHGPFQYFTSSHKSSQVIKDQVVEGFDFNQNRFEDAEVDAVIRKAPERLMTVLGKAGTLVVMDTRGIHRGKPIETGERYALTNYYWSDMEIPPHVASLIVPHGDLATA
jgi:hypothetical protein